MPVREKLLDSESWAGVLEVYARSVNMAVALIDHEGAMIGKCHNPQPVWSLAREARPEWGPGCPFCLDANGRCSAAADAERTRTPVVALGLGGFVHTAVPLFLADQHFGTLIAGQVFDRYPELLLLERVAAEFSLSGQELWRVARQLVPISRVNLISYGNLLFALGNAFLSERYSAILQQELADTNEKLRDSNEDLRGKVLELDESIAEKDILLNEVHHRVNNNLAVIGGLLRMQAEAFPDAQVAEALRDSQLRVESMALIHAHLYNSADWRAVAFAEYAAVLADSVFRSYGIVESRITWRVDIGPLELSVNRAIPAGLILNELISNALKHAFPDGRRGSILIRGGLRGDRIELAVEDDGAGFAVDAAKVGTAGTRRQSLGLKIVEILCRQLKGSFERPHAGEVAGSIAGISFPHKMESAAGEIAFKAGTN